MHVPSTLPTTKRPTVWWDRLCQRILTVKHCKLGLDAIGQPITILWQLLNKPRQLLSEGANDNLW